MLNYGIYKGWNSKSKALPEIVSFTEQIPARIGIEFGYVLEIRGARGKVIDFCIDHPPFTDAEGRVDPPFTGKEHIHFNEYTFYLGDSIWAPAEDKVGEWRLSARMEGNLISDKTFTIIPDTDV